MASRLLLADKMSVRRWKGTGKLNRLMKRRIDLARRNTPAGVGALAIRS